jgi:putative ABC transport system permease protein
MQQTDARRPVAGDVNDMYRKAATGEGLIVSDNLAALERLRLGQIVNIPAPYGRLSLPIVGIMVDYSDQQGSILMDRHLFTRHWRDDSVNAFRVHVSDGVAVDEVRRRIVERFAGTRQIFVLTNEELKRYIRQILDQWFGMTTVQIAVAIIVAILGIVNTLTVSILDRRRELAMMRAVGAFRNQIRRTIWIEALAIAAGGLVLGCALGAINLYFMLQVSRHDVIGMQLDYEFPVSTALVLVPVILGTGFVAALWPAESAVRGSLVEALEYE